MPYTREQLTEMSILLPEETEGVINAYLNATEANRRISEENRRRIHKGSYTGIKDKEPKHATASTFKGEHCYIPFWIVRKDTSGRMIIDPESPVSDEPFGTCKLEMRRSISFVSQDLTVFNRFRVGKIIKPVIQYEISEKQYRNLSENKDTFSIVRNDTKGIEVKFV